MFSIEKHVSKEPIVRAYTTYNLCNFLQRSEFLNDDILFSSHSTNTSTSKIRIVVSIQN